MRNLDSVKNAGNILTMSRFPRLRLAFVASVSCLGAALLGLSGCQTYLGRYVTLGPIDVDDYRHLPSRRLAAAGRPRPLPVARTDSWLERCRLDDGTRALTRGEDLDRWLTAQGTTAWLILERGRVVDERYYHGRDRDSLHKCFSITKSFLAALVGIAQAEGRFSVAARLDEYVAIPPENAALGGVTVQQLLDNVSGLRYRRGVAPWRDQPRMYYSTDLRSLLVRSPLVTTPGRVFLPEDLSPLLVGYALERALQRTEPGLTLSRYAESRLWQPLGAGDALWNVDRPAAGLEKSESGLVARARDLARLGQLYLDGGRVGGRQVVPAEWVQATVRPPPRGAPNLFTDGFYQNLWWGARPRPRRQQDYFANGHFGQRIYVCPDKQLVLVRLGFAAGNVDWTEFLGRLADRW